MYTNIFVFISFVYILFFYCLMKLANLYFASVGAKVMANFNSISYCLKINRHRRRRHSRQGWSHLPHSHLSMDWYESRYNHIMPF